MQAGGVVPYLAGIVPRLCGSRRAGAMEVHTFLPTTSEKRQVDPDLARYLRQRKNRRSHDGPCWKAIFHVLLQGVFQGHCDLALLLDPIFLHISRAREILTWYPGLEYKRLNIPNLASALLMLDYANPGRNQYRGAIAQHPGYLIPRLPGKCFQPLSLEVFI